MTEQEIVYRAFFDELEQIEKVSMLHAVSMEKDAGVGKWLGSAMKGFRQVGRSLSGSAQAHKVAPWEQVRKAWGRGTRRAAGLGPGVQGSVLHGTVPWYSQAYHGAKQVSRLPVGRAAMLTGGGLLAAGGAAHMMGRATAQR